MMVALENEFWLAEMFFQIPGQLSVNVNKSSQIKTRGGQFEPRDSRDILNL